MKYNLMRSTIGQWSDIEIPDGSIGIRLVGTHVEWLEPVENE